MLFKDLKALIIGFRAHDYAATNIESVQLWGTDAVFYCDKEEIEGLKSEIEDLNGTVKDLETKLKEEETNNENWEAEVVKLKLIIEEYTTDKGEFIKDLLERNSNQEKDLIRYKDAVGTWRKQYSEDQAELKKLRARQNKGIITRCVNTGKLICEFKGEKFYLGDKL